MTLDPYEELGVPRNASADEIKAAHRRGVRKHHPDAGGMPEKFGALQRSYEILADPNRRARYDETGDTDGPGLAEMEAAVLAGVSQLLAMVVGDAMDLETTDVRKVLMDTLAQTTAKIAEARRDVEKRIKRLEKVEKKFRRKKAKGKAKGAADQESTIFRLAIRGQHDQLSKELRQIERNAEMHERVVGVFKAFDYDFVPPPPMPPMRPSHASFGFVEFGPGFRGFPR